MQGGDTAFEEGGAERVAVVAAIGEQFAGQRQGGQHHRRPLVIAHLAFGQKHHDRTALPIADGVKLGVQAPLGPPDTAGKSPS